MELEDCDMYNIVQQLGKGAYGNVYLVENKENLIQDVQVMKQINLDAFDDATKAEVLREAKLLELINH